MAEELTTTPDIEEEVEEQTETQIIDQFEKEKKNYEQASQSNRAEIKEIYSVYMGKTDEVITTPYDTKETIPKLRTEIAYVKPFILSGQPEIEIEGVGDEDHAISRILEKIVNYRISQSIPNAYEKIEAWVHQAVTFGTSVIKVIWRFETVQGEDGFETPIMDMPDLQIPNILDVYYNPMIPEVSGQSSLIFRSVLALEDIKDDERYNYTNKEGQLNREIMKGKGKMTADAFDSSSQQDTDTLSNQSGMVEIYEICRKKRLQTIAVGEKTMVLRDTEGYDGINAVKLLFEPNTIPNIFDGLGVGQNTLGLGKSYHKMFNQTLTNVKMTNNPMFLFTKGSRIDKRQLVSKPGGGIEVDSDGKPIGDSIKPLIFPDIKSGAIEMLNLIDDEHKRASGANDLMQGSASNDTLGQDEIAQANVSNRFELIVRRFKRALAEVAQMIIDLELKNLQSPDAEILRIFPQEVREQVYQLLINEARDIKYNVKVKGDTNIARNKNLESKRLVDLFDLSQNFLTDQEKRSFIRKIAEKQGMDNIDEIIQQQNPIADQQEQLAAQQPQGQFNQVGAQGNIR